MIDMWKRATRALVWIFVAALAAGCGAAERAQDASQEGEDGVVTGTLKLPENAEVPPDAFVEVSLKDVSPLMLTSPIVGQAIVRPQGGERAIPFTLHYDPGLVDPERDYALEAALRDGPREVLATRQPVRVVTKRRPRNVVLVLVEKDGG